MQESVQGLQPRVVLLFCDTCTKRHKILPGLFWGLHPLLVATTNFLQLSAPGEIFPAHEASPGCLFHREQQEMPWGPCSVLRVEQLS